MYIKGFSEKIYHFWLHIIAFFLTDTYYQEYIIEKRVCNFHICTLSKMGPLSNSVYSSVFVYNSNVLTRPYQHLTTKASIEPHHITC